MLAGRCQCSDLALADRDPRIECTGDGAASDFGHNIQWRYVVSLYLPCLQRHMMTFPSTSPSVYVAYHESHPFISYPTVRYIARSSTYNTTIAYAPEDSSASISARAHQTCAFSEISYTKLADYPLRNAKDFILSLPGALLLVGPAWSTCAPATYRAFDPPYTMKRASALTDPTPEPTSSTQAAPGGYVRPGYGPRTTDMATKSSGSGVSEAVQKPAASRTSLQRSSSTDPVIPGVSEASSKTAAAESPSDTPSSIPPGGNKKPDRAAP